MVCPSCQGGIRVRLEALVERSSATCPECGTVRDLAKLDVGVDDRRVLLDHPPEEAAVPRGVTPSEFPE